MSSTPCISKFTHQGLDWAGEDNPLRYLRGVPFPLRQGDAGADSLVSDLTARGQTEAASRLQDAMTEGWDDERIRAAFAPVGAWAIEYRKSIIVDEFGVLGRYAGLEDRASWLRAVRMAAERYCFGWTHWEFAEGFGFLNASGSDIEPERAKALLGTAGK
jgi:endoglucanase